MTTRNVRRIVLALTLMALSGSVAANAAAAAPATAAGTALPSPGVYALDPPHTFVYFAAQHLVVGKVRGRFDKMSGTLTVAGDLAACAVDVSIEAGSVDTQNSTRDEDLRSASFFDAAKSPTIRYRGQGIRKSGDEWVIDGSLTIRDITKPVPLTFVFTGAAPSTPGKPQRVAFHATAATQRALFGMTRDLLEEIGSVSTGSDVWIEIDAEAVATSAPKG